MSGSNFTPEIRNAMQSKSKAKAPPPATKSKGKVPPPKAPPAPHAAKTDGPRPPLPEQANAPSGGGVPGLHSAVPQAGGGKGGGLEQAHAQVVHALMMRDKGGM